MAGTGYRGRLIWPIIAEFGVLDTAATAEDEPDNDASSGMSPGYDPIFREPRIVPPTNEDTGAGAPRGVLARKEKIVRCRAQWEVANFDFQQQWASGPSPSHRIGLVLHYRDLERRGLLDADGKATIKVNDRLLAVYHKRTGRLIQRIKYPPHGPGLYVTEAEPSMGLSGLDRNLLTLTLEDRERSVRRA